MRHILIVLLSIISISIGSAQIKLTQVEKDTIQFRVPVAHRVIPGQSGYFLKYMTAPALFDSLGIELYDSIYVVTGVIKDTIKLRDGDGFALVDKGLVNGVRGTGTATRVAWWGGTDSLSSSGNFYWDNSEKRLGVGDYATSPTDRLTISGYTGDHFIGLNNILSNNNRTFKLVAGIPGGSYQGFSIYDTYAATHRLYISNSGNVGIGNNDDVYKLAINGDLQVISRSGTPVLGAAFNGVGKLVEMSGLPPMGAGAENKIAYWQNSTTLSFQNWWHINPTDRRIGINTSSPTDALTISGYTGTDFIGLNNQLSTNNRTFKLAAGIPGGSYQGFSIYDTHAGADRFYINNDGLVRIKNLAGSGNRMVISNGDGELSTQTINTFGNGLTETGGAITANINGTQNRVAKFTSQYAVGNSTIYTVGDTLVGINQNNPQYHLDVTGKFRVTNRTGTAATGAGFTADGQLISYSLDTAEATPNTYVQSGTSINITGSGTMADPYTINNTAPENTRVKDSQHLDLERITNDTITGTIISGSIGPTELQSTSVSAGTYNFATVVVDQDGRITSASSGTDQQGVYSIATTSPITGGAITSTGTIGINNSAADGSTKGAASFTAADFNDNGSGLIEIDYTNGQAASGSTKGFLTSANWTTFNNKMELWGYRTQSGTGSGVISYISNSAVIDFINGTGITIGRATGTNNVTITNTGVTSLNGLGGSMFLSTGNSGTYPNWSSSGTTLIYNLPSGSSGQVLKHNGTGWSAGADNGGVNSVNGATGTVTLSIAERASFGQTFDWNGTQLRVPKGSSTNVLQYDALSGGWVAGTAISLLRQNSDTYLSANAITLANGTGINITDNNTNTFTITNTGDLSATNEIQGFIHSGTGSYTGTLSPSNGGVGERILLNTSGHKMVISHNGSGAVTFSTDDAYASVEGSSSLSLSGSFQTATFNTGLSYSAGSISTSSSGVTVNSTGAYEISFTAQIDHGAPTLTGRSGVQAYAHSNGTKETIKDQRPHHSAGDAFTQTVSHSFVKYLSSGSLIQLALRQDTSAGSTATLTDYNMTVKKLSY
jgi:trimeric autotransporter adhesin